MKRVFFLIVFFLCGLPTSLSAQRAPTNTPRPTIRKEAIENRVERQAEIRRREAEIERRMVREPAQATKTVLPLKPKHNKEQEKRLLPSQEDLTRFASFLRQPKTGLIRLFPDADCQTDSNVVRVAERCSDYIPGSAFYSFRENEYTLEGLADIRYKNGFLISDPLVGQGILASLGEVGLENVSLDSDGVKFLSEYQAPLLREEALKQYNELSKGVIAGKYLYRNTMPVGENITYALRVVTYRGNFFGTLLEGDERKDLILVMRVVRKDANNGITILWRELSSKEPPRLLDPKDK